MGNQQPFRAAPTELGGMGDAFCYRQMRLTALPIRRRVMKIKKTSAPRLRGDSLPGHQLDQRQLN